MGRSTRMCELTPLGPGDSERLVHQAAGLATGTRAWGSLGYHEDPGVVRIRTQVQDGGDDGDSRRGSGGIRHSCPWRAKGCEDRNL